MTDIVAVLVVPAEGDPGGLLNNGPCAFDAPAEVGFEECEGWRVATQYAVRALPLSWDGELVPEGWDRARRVLWYGTPDRADRWDLWREFEVDPAHLIAFGEALVRLGLASRVVRLARVDGRLVELEPVGVGP